MDCNGLIINTTNCQHKANNYKDNDNMFTSKHRMEDNQIVLEQGGCSNFEHKKYSKIMLDFII